MSKPKTTTAKAPAKATETKTGDETHTKLADVQRPAELTDAKIKEISGDDGSDDAENSANRDVTEALKQERDEARDPDESREYFRGQGGASGV